MMNRLREIRKERGVAQYELSSRTKVSPAIISLIENKHVAPSDDLKRRLAKGLGVPVRKLFPRAE